MTKSELKRQVVIASRENGISYALFRNVIGKQLSLSSTDFESLDLVFYRGRVTPSELAKFTGLTSGSTTIMIDRLEKAGLVTRESNPDDRRGVLVAITPKAAITIGPLFTSLRVAQNEMLASYSADELEVLSDYFKRSTELLETERVIAAQAAKAIKKIVV